VEEGASLEALAKKISLHQFWCLQFGCAKSNPVATIRAKDVCCRNSTLMIE
jgi:hypothetical protein